MIMSRDQNIVRNGNIKIGDLPFEEVGKFKYLGATVTNINDTREEIKRRINMGNACYYSVKKLLSSSLLSKNLKVRIYKTVLLPVVLYGCETWTLTLREEHRLRVFENKVLRKIFGAKRDEVTGEWRKLHNAELHALYSSPDIIRNIKSRRLRWVGHVARMGESRNAYRVHCSEYETLPHVLGSCPQGEVLRIKRHNTIRSMIPDALRSKNLDVHEEVHCIADGGSNRRIDIIAINRNKQTAEIIDPTIRFEISATQPSEVNKEKKKIYEPTIQHLSAKYNIEKITVTGLFFGARGTIPKAFVKWREKYKLTRDLQDAIVTTIIKFSVAIFRQHLYGVQRTAGYTLLDRKRNEEILEQLEVESVEEKNQQIQIKLARS
ncbi:hypothetical protein ANN_05829 [Periplaneta americana]|uniref:Reverse transcriptase n=1 Tax=Periplaneta americana TaxID=6978 RepID=A0ABQ8TBW6_PERAM|nr:hypothetical protein ANN_05829 [Periplaneta americana]